MCCYHVRMGIKFGRPLNFDKYKGKVQTVCTSSVGFELQLRICLSLTRRVQVYI